MRSTSASFFATLVILFSSTSAFGQAYWIGGGTSGGSTDFFNNWDLPVAHNRGGTFSNETTHFSGSPSVTNPTFTGIETLPYLDVRASVVNIDFSGASIIDLANIRVGSTFGYSQLLLENIATTISKSIWVGHDSATGLGPAKLVIGKNANVLSKFNRSPALGALAVFSNSNLVIDGGSLTLNTVFSNSADLPQTGSINTGGQLTLDNNGVLNINSNFTLTNNGTISGDGSIFGNVSNSVDGRISVRAGDRLQMEGFTAGTNMGAIDLVGGEIDVTSATTNAQNAMLTARDGTLRFQNGLTNNGGVGVSFGTIDYIWRCE